MCLSVCLSACISQVKLSLPGTFDLVQPAQKLDTVCRSGYGDHKCREYISRDYRNGGTTEAGKAVGPPSLTDYIKSSRSIYEIVI